MYKPGSKGGDDKSVSAAPKQSLATTTYSADTIDENFMQTKTKGVASS